jgi:cephalosporin-C deacetylase-like acetyl esterase
MNLKIINTLVFVLTLLNISVILAQQPEKLVKVVVAPNHTNWLYKSGEPAQFKISILKNRVAVQNVKVIYEVGAEQMAPTQRDSAVLKEGELTIAGGTMKEPGFLRCKVTAIVEGVRYSNLATAAYSPDQIKPVAELPEDFNPFWEKAKAANAKIPMDVRLTLLPERCTAKVNVYQANIQNYQIGRRLYGILCVPKKQGKYPAILKVPGAGVYQHTGDIELAEKGVITFQIGIHGISLTLDPGVYNDLMRTALRDYRFYNLDDKNEYYYKRVYMGCIRAIDFLYSLPEFDGVNLAVTGGSQGGALTIVTAALDSRVKYIAAFYPALCDLTGELHGRAGGWPHFFGPVWKDFNNKKDKIETTKYYDVVNFARNLKVPGFYSWGYNDDVCPPTSMYAAYNVIQAPKSLYVFEETGHWTYPEQQKLADDWLIEKLTSQK